MTELIPTSSEAEWLEARKRGITASEIAIVMGLSPWSSPYKLYHQKLGILPRDEVTPAMERGNVLEPYVVERFAAAHPELAVRGDGRTLFAHRDRRWQLATPDRMLRPAGKLPMDYQCCELHRSGHGVLGARAFCCDPDDCGPCCERCPTCPTQNGTRATAVLETKTTTDMSDWGEPGTDEIPVHYRAQVLWQMDVMGVHVAHVAVLDIRQWDVSEYVVQHEGIFDAELGCADWPDPQPCTACSDLNVMRQEAERFLKRLENEDPPDVDWSAATIGALKQLHPSVTDEDAMVGDRLGANYLAACRNVKHWEQRKKLYEARIREQMGSARRAWTAVGSELVARRDVYEVREHVRKASVTDKLVPINPKKAVNEHADSE